MTREARSWSNRPSPDVRRWSCCALWLLVLTFPLGEAIAASSSSPAETPRFKVDPPWTTQKGLPESSVFSLLQTRDGYLWVGTGYGLARFDGIHFKTFEQPDAPSLNRDWIVKTFEDSQTNLWIGTFASGVFIVSSDGKVSNLKLLGTGPEGKLVNICEDRSGAIWLSTATKRLARYSGGRLNVIPGNCNGLAADSSGIIWIGAEDPQNHKPKLVGLGPISRTPINSFQVAYEVPVEKLDFLLASKNGGYWRLANNHVQKCVENRVERDFGLFPWHSAVAAACEDELGNLIVATYGSGVWWLNSQGQFSYIDGLPSSYIFSVCMDREGSLWVGTDARGLNRVRRKVFETAETASGLAITSVCADKGGGLWVGINNGGINYSKNGKTVREYRDEQGLTDRNIRSVLTDQAGQVWVGTLYGIFQLQGEKFVQLESPPSLDLRVGVDVIYQDRLGLVWFGTGQGLLSREPKRIHFTRRDGLCSDVIQALADDRAGNFWIGTPEGLNRFRDGRFSAFRTSNGLPSEDIRSLYVDPEDTLWVGTSSGLGRFDGNRWTRFSKDSGLPDNPIGYITEDAEHFLWLGTLAGLIRVNKNELNKFTQGSARVVSSRVYGIEDGLPDSQCSARSQPAAAIANGALWFPTIQGLASVRPEQIRPNTNPPPVRIEDVRVQGRLQNTNSFRAAPLHAITIHPDEEGLEINYASLNLVAPERARFRHRLTLAGHQAPWTEAGNVRVAHYPTLPPGEYQFEVTACNEDGVWNDMGAKMGVSVLPPFWRTPWFIAISTLCLLGIVVGFVHYASTQRLQRQVGLFRQQEALEKERARIARDLHDQLGANLTQVALLGEMVETDKNIPEEVESHARQISSTARETTHALDEIVWTVNPSNDTLDGLINYVCKYAQEYLALAGLKYRLEVPAQLPATPISPELRHNVFLAAKEAVNNVVKHAKASSAWLRLHLEPDKFILEIEDDGQGIAVGHEKKGRSGLGNMRKRMEDISGKFEAGPGEQGGTRIRLVAPLKPPATKA